jgi:hypothetical protein
MSNPDARNSGKYTYNDGYSLVKLLIKLIQKCGRMTEGPNRQKVAYLFPSLASSLFGSLVSFPKGLRVRLNDSDDFKTL